MTLIKTDPSWLASSPNELAECGDCTLIYQRYVGGPELLNDLYSEWVWEPDDPEQVPMYRET